MIDFCALRTLTSDLQQVEEDLVDAYGLTIQQASVLCAVESGYGEPGALAFQMRLSPSRLTRLLDALEKQGLVERTAPARDRRSVCITLTAKGKEKLDVIHHGSVSLPSYIESMISARKEERG